MKLNKNILSDLHKLIPSIGLFFCICTNLLFAQESDAEFSSQNVELPVLNNHKFIVNSATRSPFIKSYFNNQLGFGQALDLQVPIVDIDGETVVGLRGTLYFLILDFEYQYAVNDWLAVWLKFGISSRIGDGPQTLLAQGINATTGSEFGWLLKIMETKKTFLSATVNMWNSSGTVIDLYNYLNRIIDEGEIAPDNQLIITRNFIQIGGGLRFAWAASDLFGVNALAEFSYGESVDRRDDKDVFYNLAVSSDVDLNRVVNVPIGFVLGLTMSSFMSGSDTSIKGPISSLFFKTVYTGEDDFLIGLKFLWRKMPLYQNSQTLYGGSAVLSIDYYF